MGSEPPVPPCIPGDVDLLSVVQGNFAAIATAAARSRNQLLSAGGQIVWSGAAHDAFQSALKDVPYDLQKVNTSFGQAASALAGYLRSISNLQEEYSRGLRRFLPLWEHQQNLVNQLANDSSGFSVTGPSEQQQHQQQSLQNQIAGNSAELDQLYGNLFDLWMQASGAATLLAAALDDASNAGIQDNVGNTFQRYGGDVAGFVAGVAEGVAHDVEELVAALANFEETELKLAEDILEGHWSKVGQDLDQMLLDVNDIARSLSSLLMTLTPILEFIPGVGEIVDVLDVICLVATVVTVASDAAMIGVGGSARDPLTGQPVNLRKDGESNILGDSISLAFSFLPGGGGLTDSAADDAATDAIREGQDLDAVTVGEDTVISSVEPAERFTTSMEDALGKFAEENPDAELSSTVKTLQKMYDAPTESSLSDIFHYRQFMSDSIARTKGLWEKDPEVFNHFGIKLSYRTFRRISAVTHGMELGDALHSEATDPSGDNDASAAATAADAGHSIVAG